MNTPDATPVALDTWPRREAYTFFSGLSDPFYSVTVTADVTALHTYTKRRGLSFYYALARSRSITRPHSDMPSETASQCCSHAVNRASPTCTPVRNNSTS